MIPIFWGLLLVSAALSSFFALASNALRMFRRSQLEEILDESEIKPLLEKIERHVKALRLTSSLCRSLSNLAIVLSLWGLLGAPLGGWGPVILATVIAGAIIALFGVAIPHAWASYARERIVVATLPVLMGFRYALYPLVVVMEWMDVPVRRLSGVVDSADADSEAAKLEILQAASDGRAEGSVDPEEVEMIESVMEFGETHAGEIMTPRTDIFAVPVDISLDDAAERVFQAGHSRIPVYDGDLDHIVGILYAKDLLQCFARREKVALADILRKPFLVPASKPLDDLLREFKARKVHIAVILDEYGGTAGLVTIEDVLEEIVGDISDEYDRPEDAPLRRVDDSTVEVDGRLHIDDLNDALDLEIPEDGDYDTVAGYLFSELGYIPAKGEKFEAQNVRFTVLDADERKITNLRVELLAPEDVAE